MIFSLELLNEFEEFDPLLIEWADIADGVTLAVWKGFNSAAIDIANMSVVGYGSVFDVNYVIGGCVSINLGARSAARLARLSDADPTKMVSAQTCRGAILFFSFHRRCEIRRI
jgi:hypothetical protein